MDPRVSLSATFGKDCLPGAEDWQRQQLARALCDELVPRQAPTDEAEATG